MINLIMAASRRDVIYVGKLDISGVLVISGFAKNVTELGMMLNTVGKARSPKHRIKEGGHDYMIAR